jgi:hypothetical protein
MLFRSSCQASIPALAVAPFDPDGGIGADELAFFTGNAGFPVPRFHHRGTEGPQLFGPADGIHWAFFDAQAATLTQGGEKVKDTFAVFRGNSFKNNAQKLSLLLK